MRAWMAQVNNTRHPYITRMGIYMNAASECLQRYKNSTVKAPIHRTYKISCNWHHFQNTLKILKQSLINNGCSNQSFVYILAKNIGNICKGKSSDEATVRHKIFYQNQFSEAYKIDKRVLKHIIKNNTTCLKQNKKNRSDNILQEQNRK